MLHVALAVRGAAGQHPAVLDDGHEGRRLPQVDRVHRLDVVVAVDEHGGLAGGVQPVGVDDGVAAGLARPRRAPCRPRAGPRPRTRPRPGSRGRGRGCRRCWGSGAGPCTTPAGVRRSRPGSAPGRRRRSALIGCIRHRALQLRLLGPIVATGAAPCPARGCRAYQNRAAVRPPGSMSASLRRSGRAGARGSGCGRRRVAARRGRRPASKAAQRRTARRCRAGSPWAADRRRASRTPRPRRVSSAMSLSARASSLRLVLGQDLRRPGVAVLDDGADFVVDHLGDVVRVVALLADLAAQEDHLVALAEGRADPSCRSCPTR